MKTNLIKRLEHQQEQRQRPARSSTHAPEAGKEFRAFGQAHVGGERGYWGKYYAGRYALAVKLMIDRYGLTSDSTVLEVGCGPGFMVYEFTRLDIPNAWGCAGSSSAIEGGKPESRERLKVMDLDRLEYPDASFDLVYSVDALHHLEPDACDTAVCEIMRVSDGSSFIQVNTFETPEQERNLREWAVTMKTVRSKEQWRAALDRLGYQGDYFFKVFNSC